ncbi:hypothetical protein AB6A40_003191 [Gnathostoma spinigerum]|uniref:Maturase K n=1 Tax=Gnathostoma spinigerum TaxID=75299 RepID=A0ABD6EB43_9BILA
MSLKICPLSNRSKFSKYQSCKCAKWMCLLDEYIRKSVFFPRFFFLHKYTPFISFLNCFRVMINMCSIWLETISFRENTFKTRISPFFPFPFSQDHLSETLNFIGTPIRYSVLQQVPTQLKYLF